jgi:hypothetical protein
VIDSAWVDDGHCDCCDGTDDPAGACKDERWKAGKAARTGLDCQDRLDAAMGADARCRCFEQDADQIETPVRDHQAL